MAALPQRKDRGEDRGRELFDQALELPEEERAAFLARGCGDDRELRRELDSLLRLHDEAGQVLRDPTAPVTEQPGDHVGHYKLLQRIGEGTFGTVWMAEQEQPVRRKVALKVLKAGMDTAQVVARFEAERQALAMMDHPNIAKIFDGGVTVHGRPYFVMELVRGVPITRYCDDAALSTRERLELFILLCHAVQHAHQKGVIHRDLKPSNVLVTLHDGVPVPKVIDFGIAKATQGRLTERTLFTAFQQMVGTPEYMAPEQAELSGLDVDTRADVYSLGVLLYELLTGTRPFDLQTLLQSGYAEVLRTIKEVEPQKPSTRVSTLGDRLLEVCRHRRIHPRAFGSLMRGDLDWIVMKTLEKERGRRYVTAAALADDVQRHLRNEPVDAGPPSRLYKLRKYVLRHRVGVVAGVLIALSLVVGAAAAGWGWLRADHQARAAKTSATRAQRVVALLDQMLGSADPHAQKGPNFTVRQLLDDFDREFTGQLDGEPEVEASLRATLAGSFAGLGLPAPARAQMVQARKLRLQLFGDQSAEHADSLLLESACSHLEGRYADALPVSEQAVTILRRLGSDHAPKLAEALLSVGDLRWHLAQEKEADAAFREVERIGREVGNEAWVTKAMERRGVACHTQGRLADAESLLRQVIERRRAHASGDSLELAGSLGGLAIVLNQRGELDEALQLAEEALRMARAAAGEVHASVAYHMKTLASVLNLRGEPQKAAELLEDAAEMQREVLGETSLKRAETLHLLASVESHLGKLSEAERHGREALDIDSKVAGEETAGVADDQLVLSRILVRNGNLEESEQLARAALATLERVRGKEHPDAANARFDLAQVLDLKGRHDEAETHLRQVLDILTQAGNEYVLTVTKAQYGLASLLLDAGRPKDALPFAEAALEAQRKLHGDEGPRVDALLLLARIRKALGDSAGAQELAKEALTYQQQQPLSGLESMEAARRLSLQASFQHERGDFAGAEASARSALTMQERLLAPDHLDCAASRSMLGVVLEATGRLDDAEAEFQRSLDIYRRHLDDPHDWIAGTLGKLGGVQIRRGDGKAAARYYRDALDMRERLGGPQNVEFARDLQGLGDAQRLLGNLPEAVRRLREALELRRRLSSTADPEVANNLNNLGFALLLQRDFVEAERALRETLEMWKTLKADWGRVWTTVINLGMALDQGGKVAEAEQLYREQLTFVRGSTLPPMALAGVAAQLGQFLLDHRRAADAEPLLAECLKIRSEQIPDDYRTHIAMSLLGGALFAQGKHAEAEPLLETAAEKMRPPAGLSQRRRDAIARVIALYEATGRTEKAETWRKVLAEAGPGR